MPIDELLDIDAQYRHLAGEGQLPRIAPRRFNPTGEAWLPVLHTQRHERHYTALFSNTARAHELGTTHDWVVIYRDDPHADGRSTVITSQFGKLRRLRIVPGREGECAAWHTAHSLDRPDRPSSPEETAPSVAGETAKTLKSRFASLVPLFNWATFWHNKCYLKAVRVHGATATKQRGRTFASRR